MENKIKTIIDFFALGTTLAVLGQVIPVVAGLFSIVWGYYRIKEIRLSIQLKEQRLTEK